MKEIHISEIEHLEDKISFIKGLFNGDNFDVCFHYQSDFQKTQLLRDIVDIISNVSGLDDRWRRRVVLIVDELNNNAIEYGSAPNDINKMRFCLTLGKHISLKIEVQDCGTGEHTQKADYMRSLQSTKTKQGFDNHDSIRGRGLFMIIVNLVDRLYFEDAQGGGLIVGVEKNFV